MKSFEFRGFIGGVDSGKIELIKLAGEGYYDISLDSNVVSIVNGKFRFNGKLSFPQPFYAKIVSNNNTKAFGFFFIDKGLQSLVSNIDSLSSYFTTINGSVTNQEYILKFKPLSAKAELFYKEWMDTAQNHYKKYGRNTPNTERIKIQKLSQLYKTEFNLALQTLIKNNTSSYVSLWCLISEFNNGGYSNFKDSAEQFLSNRIRLTKPGRYLRQSLNEAMRTSVGMIFPKYNFLNINNDSSSVPTQTKYTLIDYWFSSCTPCIAEFPHLQKIYAKFKGKGFEIISISIDTKNRRGNWVQAIQKYHLEWPQLWDTNGDIAIKQLYINSYPTNFLLDSNGKILKKNISTIDLDKFLESNK